MRFVLKFFCISILFICCSACQTTKDYHDYLIDKSFVTEVPTLMGNLLGGICTSPFLLLTIPTGYIIPWEDSEETSALKARQNFILSPLAGGTYAGGILLGTPFLPFGLLVPRTSPEEIALQIDNSALEKTE